MVFGQGPFSFTQHITPTWTCCLTLPQDAPFPDLSISVTLIDQVPFLTSMTHQPDLDASLRSGCPEGRAACGGEKGAGHGSSAGEGGGEGGAATQTRGLLGH